MKRKMLIIGVFCLIAVSVFALPDYPMWTVYYDEDGNVVGERSVNCAGQWYTTGTMTDNSTVEYGERCDNEVQLYTCQDFNLTTLPGESFPSCVSEGYRVWWCTRNQPQCVW
jgi:hypothetical protein